jgi:hypothetical protein
MIMTVQCYSVGPNNEIKHEYYRIELMKAYTYIYISIKQSNK